MWNSRNTHGRIGSESQSKLIKELIKRLSRQVIALWCRARAREEHGGEDMHADE
jgi:hypothetical protein